MKIFKEEYEGFAESEIANLKKMNHPNVVKYLDSGQEGCLVDTANNTVDDNLKFVLLEYASGGALDDV